MKQTFRIRRFREFTATCLFRRGRAQCVALLTVALITCLATQSGLAQRPPVSGRTAGVSAGHPLTTAAAFEILLQGGNAFDAGVTSLLVGGVVEQDLYGLGGEALILVYPKAEDKVISIVGRAGHRNAPRSTGISNAVATSTAKGSTRRSFPVRCTGR